jgi:surface antigen
MNFRKLTAIITATSLLGACSQYNTGGQGGYQMPEINKEVVGGVVGAGLGAVTGSNIGKGKGQIAAIAIGTLLGAKLGSSVGASLDRADMIQYNYASQRALEVGQPNQQFPWSNPQSGNSGMVVPQGYYQQSNGTYCREYTQTINVGGRVEEAYGTACRQNDGTWKITG